MDRFERLREVLGHFGRVLFSFGSTFGLPSLAVAFCVAIGFLAWRQHARRGRVSLPVIRRAVFRERFFAHRSFRADFAYALVNTLALGGLIGWGVFGADTVSRVVESGLKFLFGPRSPIEGSEFALRAGVTLALFLAYEFGYWLDHFLKHRVAFLWETHKPHHSAEMLTPWTVWRVHPLDSLVFTNILSLTIGAASGLLTYALGREVGALSIDGSNVILVFFIYAYVHLQHSQFWIPFTGPLGRVFMSPAQHQIHHSIDPRHHNRNFGSCLSVFDWLFGTLETPSRESPRLKFGVVSEHARPHSLTSLLITPTVASLGLLLRDLSGALSAGLATLRGARRIQPR